MCLLLHKACRTASCGNHIKAWCQATDIELSRILFLQHQTACIVVYADRLVVHAFQIKRIADRVGPEGEAGTLGVGNAFVLKNREISTLEIIENSSVSCALSNPALPKRSIARKRIGFFIMQWVLVNESCYKYTFF